MSGEMYLLSQRYFEQWREATRERDDARKKLAVLMRQIGQPAICRGCDSPILWVHHANGKPVPYNPDGTNHFSTCAESALFKRINKDGQ